MPELPEVETVRRGLQPAMLGARFARVSANRPDLRFPFPEKFEERLEGARIETMDRRGKYLLCGLSTGETLIMHLGMSGRFTVSEINSSLVEGRASSYSVGDGAEPGVFHHERLTDPVHDHVIFDLSEAPTKAASGTHSPAGKSSGKSLRAFARVVYNDPRRFGFMDLVPNDKVETCKHFKAMGPEPLSNSFSADHFSESLKGRLTPIKAALLDQRIVAGIGNIYACEALFRSGISPRRKASSVAGVRAVRLHKALISVLQEAIEAGGSSLRDFAGADGDLGYFQHRFSVYDREGQPCLTCGATIKRLVQGGRSTFYCGTCQR